MMSSRASRSVAVSLLLVPLVLAGCGDDDGGQNNSNGNSNQNNASAGCSNGVIEGDEVCDGSALGGEDCVGQGFDGGELACSSGCDELLTAGCCLDGCSDDGATQCDGDTLQTCEEHASGCMDWTLLDCTGAGQICHDTGSEAFCTGDCTSDCDTEGAHQCDGDAVEVCAVNGICLNWAVETTCASQVGCDSGACRDDADGDGFSVFLGDCDDGDGSVYPDATEIPGDGIDQNCDGSDGRVGVDQYVPATYALAALEYAIQTCVDAADDCYVYVERKTFELTAPLAIDHDSANPHEVGIFGGYDTDGSFLTRHFGDATAGWSGSYGTSTDYATVIRYAAATTEQRTVALTGSHPDNRLWLDGLRVEGPTASVAGGASVAVAIYGADASVRLDRSRVVGGVAGDGAAATSGSTGNSGGPGGKGSGGVWGNTTAYGGSAGSSTCSPGHEGSWSHYAHSVCSVAFDHADAYHGTDGANNFEAQPNCNTTSLPMHAGGTGGDGPNGTAGGCGDGGQAAPPFGSLAAGLWSPPAAAGDGVDGQDGTGGYGGGSGGGYIGSCSATGVLLGGGGGGGGGGGCKGTAGGAGGHGGSSFGILVTDADPANITLDRLTVELGTAGHGAAGGHGGNGGNGGTRGDLSFGRQWGGGHTCKSGDSGYGGYGAPGGGGGGGAGGNGGASVGLGATVAVDDSNVTYAGGAAGDAGTGGSTGASGTNGTTCTGDGGDGSAGQVLSSKKDY
jgi:hypothetical protein